MNGVNAPIVIAVLSIVAGLVTALVARAEYRAKVAKLDSEAKKTDAEADKIGAEAMETLLRAMQSAARDLADQAERWKAENSQLRGQLAEWVHEREKWELERRAWTAERAKWAAERESLLSQFEVERAQLKEALQRGAEERHSIRNSLNSLGLQFQLLGSLQDQLRLLQAAVDKLDVANGKSHSQDPVLSGPDVSPAPPHRES